MPDPATPLPLLPTRPMTKGSRALRWLRRILAGVTVLLLVCAAANLCWDLRFFTGRVAIQLERGAWFVYRFKPGARFPTTFEAVGHAIDADAFASAWSDPPYRGLAYTWRVRIPEHWLLVPLLATAGVFWWRDCRSPERGSRCAECGYDLTGNLNGRCPECGADSTGATPDKTPPDNQISA